MTIGTASFLPVLEGCWLKTRRAVYQDLYHFWVRIFAVNFGMGVVSGLVMAYEFGTNWSGFSRFADGITGPLLAYEVLTASFLEAGLLGVMLFGWKRVGPGLHFFSTVMVALGTLVSATWIVASNSWMKTPQGFVIEDGRAVPVASLAVIFNPSFPYRLGAHERRCVPGHGVFHRRLGGSQAWSRQPGGSQDAVDGDVDGAGDRADPGPGRRRPRAEHAEVPTREAGGVRGALAERRGARHAFAAVRLARHGPRGDAMGRIVPRLGGLLLTHDWNGQITGLKEFPRDNRPNSTLVFWSFRVMVGLGILMIVLGIWGLALRRGGRLWNSALFLRSAVWMGPAGLVALLAGWFTTEVGRQPFVVYGVQRTADPVSARDAATVSASLCAFVIVYCFVFGVGGYIERIALDGSGRTAIVEPGRTFTPKQLILDAEDELLYWCDREGMRVMRSRTG